MTRLFAFLLIPLLGFALSLPGSASPKNTASTSTSNRAVGRTDSQIDAIIRTKLAKSKIGKDGFHFHVQHGVVTWEGSTSVIQHKGSATRMAKAAGATQVINNIQISDSAKAKATANLKRASLIQ